MLLSADALSDDLTTCKNLTDNYIFSQAIIVCEQLCNKNIGSGCLAMGDIYITPQFENHNLEKSKSFYDKSCNLDDALGCFKVAELYYYTPRPNYTLSLEYSRKSCHLNNADGCFLLARSYELGKGVQPDPNRAKQYYKVSCSLNNIQGCGNLSALYFNSSNGNKPDLENAKLYAEKACDSNNGVGCSVLGLMYN